MLTFVFTPISTSYNRFTPPFPTSSKYVLKTTHGSYPTVISSVLPEVKFPGTFSQTTQTFPFFGDPPSLLFFHYCSQVYLFSFSIFNKCTLFFFFFFNSNSNSYLESLRILLYRLSVVHLTTNFYPNSQYSLFPVNGCKTKTSTKVFLLTHKNCGTSVNFFK